MQTPPPYVYGNASDEYVACFNPASATVSKNPHASLSLEVLFLYLIASISTCNTFMNMLHGRGLDITVVRGPTSLGIEVMLA